MTLLYLALLAQAATVANPTHAEPVTEAQQVELVLPQVESESTIVLPRDTPVHLMVLNEVSTKKHEVGHVFRLRVNQPIVIDGRELIPVGATAWGELTDADKSGNVGKSGTLAARLTHLEHNGVRVPIEGETTATGKSGKGETLLGVLAMGPLGLFAKGDNARIKAGEKMVAFVSEDVTFDVEG